ncbi:MAG TPA: hypothetical protein VNL95_03245 [Dehalococcoidia bacterium]|nr:hypothetical protein [Dehalococcoidia bacterium]
MKAVTEAPYRGGRGGGGSKEGHSEHRARVFLLAGAYGLGLLAYLTIEPTQVWLLLLLALVAALGTDGIVRAHPHASFRRLDDTALHLFLPVTYAVASAIFLESVVAGYWSVPAALAMSLPFALLVHAEYVSADQSDEGYHTARVLLNMATYLTAFLFFATLYRQDLDLHLLVRTAAVGVVSLLLAVDVLREEALEAPRTLLYALVVGALVAQAAWGTHFLPLENNAAAVFLLLAFYLVTGLLHQYLGERLNLRTATEFGGIASLGMAAVVVAHRLV